MFEIKGKFNAAKVFGTNVDYECMSQITQLCNQEWLKGCPIAIMADCHPGKGGPVGLTIRLNGLDRISPQLLGSDIGCGTLVIDIPDELVLNFDRIDRYICKEMPHGDLHNFSASSSSNWDRRLSILRCNKYEYMSGEEQRKIKQSLGTPGNGNHFIEIGQSVMGKRYLIIHSGSRLLGQRVGRIYQELAKNNPDLYSTYPAYCLTGEAAADYLHDMKICQDFASLNRRMIAKRIMEFIAKDNELDDGDLTVYLDEIEPDIFVLLIKSGLIDVSTEGFASVHNYIGTDNVLRKGAIYANDGKQVIVPISMKEGAILEIGKRNMDCNFNAPHGAGRIMSRGDAKDALSLEEYQKEMEDIYTSSVLQSTIDEAPMVYKDIKDIIVNIKDSVDIMDFVRPLYNYKSH